MKTIVSILLLLFATLSVSAQNLISGKVSAEGVIVRLQAGGKDLTYDISNSDGKFRLSFSTLEKEVKAVFSHLSYEEKVITLENKSQEITVQLTPKTTEIKEITVSAPDVRLRGDTLVYALEAFAGLDDATLEDAMKNLPGVEVAESGTISYMGKNISNFYIEGMDLLDGRYSIATSNITPDMVSTVEVIENHQPVKMMQDKMISDAVAVNIKLKKEAKLKPMGNIEGSIGYIDKDVPYRLAATGMLFSKEFQTISTVKYGNVGKQNSSEALIHYYSFNGGGSNLAMDILGSLGGSTPPLSKNRYLNQTDGLASINTVNKFSDDDELSFNANYSYTNNDYSYSQISDYIIDTSHEIVKETSSPMSIIHSPSLDAKYFINSKELYLYEKLSGSVSILDERFPTVNLDNALGQNRTALGYNITNDFNIRKPLGSEFISFASTISYLATPKNSVTYTSSMDDTYNYIQNADGATFYTNNKIDYSFNIGRYTRLFMPLNLTYSHNRINTLLMGRDTEPNKLNGGDFRAQLSPRMEYKAPSGRFEMTINAPFGYSYVDYNQATEKYNTFLYSPSLSMKFNVSPSSIIYLNSSAGNNIGDATSFLTNPIQTSYRSAKIASGILAQSEQQSASLRYQYKIPLSYFFLDASIGYSHTMRNLLNSQFFMGENVISSTMFGDNESENFMASLSVSKFFKPIQTKIDIGGSYSTSYGDVIQQKVLTKYNSTNYGASLSLKTTPTDWMEFKYNGSVQLSDNKFLNSSSSRINHNHSAMLSFMAFKKLKIFISADYVNNQITSTDYVDMFLLDFGATYKIGDVELELSINNILDTREYAYTIFDALDTFSYSYALRGREIVLSFTLF